MGEIAIKLHAEYNKLGKFKLKRSIRYENFQHFKLPTKTFLMII